MSSKPVTKSGARLWEEAKKLIPGGSQLLSKRAEMFLPGAWPSYYAKAKGITVWDLDGKKYLDFSTMGVGACILGFADPDVNREVRRAVEAGSMTTLNCPEEVELAKLLLSLHPWAQRVRYARTGGEAMAVAVRIARAHTRKDAIAFCGYHGWHDWYLSANLASDKSLDGHLLPGLKPKGVPRRLRGTAIPFSYNHIEELRRIAAKRKDIGVIVVETMRHQEPEKRFLHQVAAVAKRIGAVLIFDEISIGWRLVSGGAHLLYGVHPDIAVFAKAMSNGFPCAAIIGKKSIMESAQETFISSTYWTDRVGPVAALATIRKLKQKRVPFHLKRIGRLISDGWRELAKKHRLNLSVLGPPALATFTLNYGNESQALRTLFTQEMLARGYLAGPSVYVSYAHTAQAVKKYLKAVDDVFAILAKAVREKAVRRYLKGPVAHSGFKRLT